MKKITQIIILSLSFTTIANAQMATFDATNAAKQIELFNQGKEQLDTLTKQLDYFKDMNKTGQDMLKTIGKVGKINVPFVNSQTFDKLIAKNQSCLMPDFKSLMPSLNSYNPKLPDLCGGRSLYRDNFFIKPQEYNQKTSSEKESIQSQITEKRNNLYLDNIEKSLAQGDIAVQQNTDLTNAINELESSADSAVDQNERLAVQNKILLLQIRATNQTNQLLATMLKLDSANKLAQLPPAIKPATTATK